MLKLSNGSKMLRQVHKIKSNGNYMHKRNWKWTSKNRSIEIMQAGLWKPVFFGLVVPGTGSVLAYLVSEDVRNVTRPYLTEDILSVLDKYILYGEDSSQFQHVKNKFKHLPKKSTQKELVDKVPLTKLSLESSKETESSKHMNDQVNQGGININLEQLTLQLKNALDDFEYTANDCQTKMAKHSESLKYAIDNAGEHDKEHWDKVHLDKQNVIVSKQKLDINKNTLEKATKSLQSKLELSPDEEKAKVRDVLNHAINKKSATLTNIEHMEHQQSLMQEYKSRVESIQQQLKKELQSINSSKDTDKDSISLMLVHAHNKMQQLNKYIAELETLQSIKIDQAVSAALDQATNDNNSLMRKVLEDEREIIAQKMEQEVFEALTRQAAIHSEHLTELMRIQHQELEKEKNLLVREALIKERDKLTQVIDGWKNRVEGLEAAVDGRADAERGSQEARELWSACRGMQMCLSGKPRPDLDSEMSRLITRAKEASNSPEIKLLVNGIPSENIQTFQELKQRFKKVAQVSSQVSMLDETGGGILAHMLSRIRSALLVCPSTLLGPESEVEPGCGGKDPNLIICSASQAVSCGDLETAVRLMSIVGGLSRAVADDWLKDTVRYLEANQSIEALSSYSYSKTLTSELEMAVGNIHEHVVDSNDKSSSSSSQSTTPPPDMC